MTPLGTPAASGPIVSAPDDDDDDDDDDENCRGIGRRELARKRKNTKKTCPNSQHESHMNLLGIEPGLPLWKAGN
jgi:hypothetical protein